MAAEAITVYYGERFNAISHLLGAILAILATLLMLQKTIASEDAYKLSAAVIYGASLIVLYAGSTLYHSIAHRKSKQVLQKVDHLAIYLLIAGSYTPFCLVSLKGAWGWSLFAVSWGLAMIGMAQEFLVKDPKRRLSLVIYMLMGWLALVAIKPIMAVLPMWALFWLVAGGLFYSIGVYWFVNDEKIRHGHGIWHIFVLAGSLSQFVCIYFWVL